jgi:zinc protease
VRDVPGLRALIAERALVMPGTRMAQRLPIGRVDTIQAATSERLRRYYAANYRPDNATIIIVGNIDVDAVEQQLRERFAGWTSDATPDVIALGEPRPTQPAAEFVADGAPDQLALSWLQPPDNRPPTAAVMRERLVRQLASGAINLRLSDRALQAGSPFLSARSSLQVSVSKATGQARLAVMATPERWQDALDGAVAELRQLLEQGITSAEAQRLVQQTISQLRAAVAQAPTRQHAAIADALVAAVQLDSPYQSAAQALAETEALLRTIKADELSYALRRDFGGQPLVFRSAKAGAVGAEALTRQLAQAMARPLTASVATQVTAWPYTDFGEPSTIVSRMQDADLGATEVLFANGTRLMVKSTAMAKDRVQVQVRLGQGRAGVDEKQVHALWALEFLPLGGTGQRSAAEISQWQQGRGKRVDVRFSADQWAFNLQGLTRPADLTAQLQLLAAFARDPGFRPELGEKLAGLAPAMASRLETLPVAVYGREVARVMNGGDARLGIPPGAADVAATRADELPAILQSALASAPDLVIVGDVSEDAAIAAVQATFGAGAERPRLPPAELRQAPVAGGGPAHVAYHRGRPDQALLGWHWPMPDQWADPALSFTGRVAAAVLRARLVDTVREKMGITYSPNVSGRGSLDMPGRGAFTAQIETPPDKFDAFRELLRTQLRELADQPVGADELQRASRPLVESVLKEPETSAYWLMWLSRIQANPLMKAQMQAETAGLRAVTAEAVQAYFRDHILPRPPIEVVARAPEAAAPAAAAAK